MVTPKACEGGGVSAEAPVSLSSRLQPDSRYRGGKLQGENVSGQINKNCSSFNQWVRKQTDRGGGSERGGGEPFSPTVGECWRKQRQAIHIHRLSADRQSKLEPEHLPCLFYPAVFLSEAVGPSGHKQQAKQQQQHQQQQ